MSTIPSIFNATTLSGFNINGYIQRDNLTKRNPTQLSNIKYDYKTKWNGIDIFNRIITQEEQMSEFHDYDTSKLPKMIEKESTNVLRYRLKIENGMFLIYYSLESLEKFNNRNTNYNNNNFDDEENRMPLEQGPIVIDNDIKDKIVDFTSEFLDGLKTQLNLISNAYFSESNSERDLKHIDFSPLFKILKFMMTNDDLLQLSSISPETQLYFNTFLTYECALPMNIMSMLLSMDKIIKINIPDDNICLKERLSKIGRKLCDVTTKTRTNRNGIVFNNKICFLIVASMAFITIEDKFMEYKNVYVPRIQNNDNTITRPTMINFDYTEE